MSPCHPRSLRDELVKGRSFFIFNLNALNQFLHMVNKHTNKGTPANFKVLKNIYKRKGSLPGPQILLPTGDTAVGPLSILPKMYCAHVRPHTMVAPVFFNTDNSAVHPLPHLAPCTQRRERVRSSGWKHRIWEPDFLGFKFQNHG